MALSVQLGNNIFQKSTIQLLFLGKLVTNSKRWSMK